MQKEEVLGESTGAGGAAGEWGRVAYLCSVFAWHPWHAPFSLQEETRETMRRGPDSGPKGSALKHSLRGEAAPGASNNRSNHICQGWLHPTL